MAAQTLLIFAVAIILFSSISESEETHLRKKEHVQLHREISSVCKWQCWDQYSLCLNIDASLAAHLLCIEARDNCTSGC